MTDKRPAFQWYPKDYLTDENVVMMTLEEEGAYRRLIDYCWLHQTLPNDVERLAPLCKVDGTRMAVLWQAIRPCFREQNGNPKRLIHPRLEKERQKQDEHRKQKSEAGKAGAKARWEKEHDGTANVLPLAKNGFPSAFPSASSKTTTPPIPPFEHEFSTFWERYPLKVGRKAALKAYQTRRRAGATAEEILAGLSRYLAYKEARQERHHNPATFLGPNEWFREPWTVQENDLARGREKRRQDEEPVLDPKFRGEWTPISQERISAKGR